MLIVVKKKKIIRKYIIIYSVINAMQSTFVKVIVVHVMTSFCFKNIKKEKYLKSDINYRHFIKFNCVSTSLSRNALMEQLTDY